MNLPAFAAPHLPSAPQTC